MDLYASPLIEFQHLCTEIQWIFLMLEFQNEIELDFISLLPKESLENKITFRGNLIKVL